VVTLVELRDALRNGQISASELITRTFSQIDSVNPEINAFIETFRDQALVHADDSDRRLRAHQARPLEGLPVTIKDSLHIAGSPTRCGSTLNCGPLAPRDATCVRLLKGAGAIVVGKTSCPEFLMNYETDNLIIGRTQNPWDTTRTAGGSSGGEAAAIAAFCSAGGIGSDGGGSIRFPAHCCGISGLKPTPGRVSGAGHIPPIEHPGGLLGVVGPMARAAADVKALFEVLARYDPADPFAAPVPMRAADLQPFREKKLRIGFMPGWLDVPVETAVRQTVSEAAHTLVELGYAVEDFRPCGVEAAPNLWWFFFGRIHSRVTQADLAAKEDQLHWTGRELLRYAMKEPEPTVAEVLQSFAARDRMRASLLDQMETHRVLLLPASGIAAFPHRQRRWQTPKKEIGLFEAMMPLTPFNLFGMPAVVIPFGFNEDRLPCGVQLVGRPYEEELLLEIAIELENARGVFPAPPGTTPSRSWV
jgi:Asp-tRNA(Asn)/Glu-tRNA(Gln) amidotransferase A subunit family amidase